MTTLLTAVFSPTGVSNVPGVPAFVVPAFVVPAVGVPAIAVAMLLLSSLLFLVYLMQDA